MSSQTAEFPVFSLDFIVDPYPTLHRLRERDPVHHRPDMGAWFVTGHEDVKRLLSDSDVLTSDHRAWEGYVPPRGRHVGWYLDHTRHIGPRPSSGARSRTSSASCPRTPTSTTS